MGKRTRSVAALVAVVFCAATLMADPAREKQLQQGRDLLEKRELTKAAALFAEVAKSEDAELAARGLYHLAVTQERQGKVDEARATYARLQRNFAGQREVVARAQSNLARLDGPERVAGPALKDLGGGDIADDTAFISFDGRYLTHPDWNTGDIVIREMRTGSTRRLLGKTDWNTPPGFVDNAMLSPDATAVVYTWYPNQGEAPPELRLIASSPGASPVTLVANREYLHFDLAGWAPNGRSVLVVARKADDELQFAWVSAKDKSIQTLKSLAHRLGRGRVTLSPDGRYLAYPLLASARTKNPQGQWVNPTAPDQHLYVLPTDGSGEERLIIGGPNVNESPMWTPDGKRLLFVSNRDETFGLWSVPVEDGRRAGSEEHAGGLVSGQIRPIGITNAGTFYYVTPRVGGPGLPGIDVYIAELDRASGRMRPGSKERLVDTRLDVNSAPAFSPDGQRVAFMRRRSDVTLAAGNGGAFPHHELIVRSLADGREQSFFTTYMPSVQPIWSRDGKSLLVRRNYNGGQLFRWTLDTAEPRSVEAIAHAMLPFGWQRAVLAPDDRTLYLSVPSASLDAPIAPRIVTFDLADGTVKTVWQPEPMCVGGTRAECLRGLPVFAVSPDGQSLALILQRNDWGAPRLVRADVAGGGYRELASPVLPGTLVWAPDGGSIFVTRQYETGAEVVRVPASGGPLAKTGIVLRQAGGAFDVARDGRIVFNDRSRDVADRLIAYEMPASLVN